MFFKVGISGIKITLEHKDQKNKKNSELCNKLVFLNEVN